MVHLLFYVIDLCPEMKRSGRNNNKAYRPNALLNETVSI